MSSLYTWKLQSMRRRVVIELNTTASEGAEPAVKVTLTPGDGFPSLEGIGSTLPEAVNDALSKDDDGGEHDQAG
jgi:hypothetical protein